MLFGSCYQDVEGCRDLLAANYSVTADSDCEDCCTYPTLRLSISHRHRDTLLLRDSVYTNSLGQAYRINRVALLCSDFTIVLDEGTRQVLDRVLIGQSQERQVRNDHFQMSTAEFSYTVGSIAGEGDLEQLQFYLGSTHSPADTTLAEDDYQLRSGAPSLAVDPNSYAAVQVTLDSLDTDTLARWQAGSRLPIHLELDGTLLAGQDLNPVLEIDYAVLLDEVDLLADSTSVAQAIAQKLDQAITLRR